MTTFDAVVSRIYRGRHFAKRLEIHALEARPDGTEFQHELYVWTTIGNVKQQLWASLCERSMETGRPVRLTGEETTWGVLLVGAEMDAVAVPVEETV